MHGIAFRPCHRSYAPAIRPVALVFIGIVDAELPVCQRGIGRVLKPVNAFLIDKITEVEPEIGILVRKQGAVPAVDELFTASIRGFMPCPRIKNVRRNRMGGRSDRQEAYHNNLIGIKIPV